jgi:SAM-dependent methyltransferase
LLPPLTPNGWLRYDALRRARRELPPADRVLELGCGLGALGVRLVAEGATYVGVEPDPASRRVAARQLPRVVASLGELAGDERFDLVLALEVLEHCADDHGELTAWSERARSGGAVLVTVPGDPLRWGAADELVGHVRRYTPAELAAALGAAGLERVVGRRYGGPLGLALEAMRNRVARRRLRGGGPTGRETRTDASGRYLQPPAAMAPLTAGATYPFRLLQRATPGVGPGLIAWGRRA